MKSQQPYHHQNNFIDSTFDQETVARIANSFDHLGEDQYIKSDFKYRQRKYGYCEINAKNEIKNWVEKKKFFQSSKYNNYLGDIDRDYSMMNDDVKNFIESLIPKVCNLAPHIWRNDCPIHAHQYRLIGGNDFQGKPTPEGIHKDGYFFHVMLCFNTENLSGGITTLLDATDTKNITNNKIIFEGQLQKGDLMIFNDESLFHYTSAITPKLPHREAKRDMLVISFGYPER